MLELVEWSQIFTGCLRFFVIDLRGELHASLPSLMTAEVTVPTDGSLPEGSSHPSHVAGSG